MQVRFDFITNWFCTINSETPGNSINSNILQITLCTVRVFFCLLPQDSLLKSKVNSFLSFYSNLFVPRRIIRMQPFLICSRIGNQITFSGRIGTICLLLDHQSFIAYQVYSKSIHGLKCMRTQTATLFNIPLRRGDTTSNTPISTIHMPQPRIKCMGRSTC